MSKDRKSSPQSLSYDTLKNAAEGRAAAFRCRTRLQPAGGEGDKVFPPTYAGAVYAMEMRRLPDFNEPVRCVLMDSVQSQANRIEEALQDAVDEKRIELPVVEVDFSHIPIVDPDSSGEGLFEPIGRITSLEAPHRVADAILRDSELNGVLFRKTDEGRKLTQATLRNATPLFELCPTALVFGIWDSTGPKGGLGVKFQRALVSEIIGVDASFGIRTSSRMDPLAIQLKAGPVYEGKDGTWTLDENKARVDKKKPVLAGKDGKPSEVNHGNIAPSFAKYTKGAEGIDPRRADEVDKDGQRFLAREGRICAGGVTIAYAEQMTVLSLPALRRLRFPIDGKMDRARNQAGQTALAALALCGAALANERGLDLRSRCLLWPEASHNWELLGKPGEDPQQIELPAEEAVELLKESVAKAKEAGLPWRSEPLQLTPADKLVKLVRKSQELAVASGADEGGE